KDEEGLGEVVADAEGEPERQERADDAPAQLLQVRGEGHAHIVLWPHAAGRFGGSSSSIAWTWNSSITSAVWRRNSAIALPSERATSGSRFGPSTTSATTRITSSSGIPIPNI